MTTMIAVWLSCHLQSWSKSSKAFRRSRSLCRKSARHRIRACLHTRCDRPRTCCVLSGRSPVVCIAGISHLLYHFDSLQARNNGQKHSYQQVPSLKWVASWILSCMSARPGGWGGRAHTCDGLSTCCVATHGDCLSTTLIALLSSCLRQKDEPASRVTGIS